MQLAAAPYSSISGFVRAADQNAIKRPEFTFSAPKPKNRPNAGDPRASKKLFPSPNSRRIPPDHELLALKAPCRAERLPPCWMRSSHENTVAVSNKTWTRKPKGRPLKGSNSVGEKTRCIHRSCSPFLEKVKVRATAKAAEPAGLASRPAFRCFRSTVLRPHRGQHPARPFVLHGKGSSPGGAPGQLQQQTRMKA